MLARVTLNFVYEKKNLLDFALVLHSLHSIVAVISIACIAYDSASCRRIYSSLLLSCQVDYYLYLYYVVFFQSLPHFSPDSTRLFSCLTFLLRPFRLPSFCFNAACGAGSSPTLASCSTSRLGLNRPFETQDSYVVLEAASHADYLSSGSS